MVVIGVGEMLEQGKEASDAFSLKSDLRIVEMFGVLLSGNSFVLVRSLSLFGLLHLSQLIHEFLY